MNKLNITAFNKNCCFDKIYSILYAAYKNTVLKIEQDTVKNGPKTFSSRKLHNCSSRVRNSFWKAYFRSSFRLLYQNIIYSYE